MARPSLAALLLAVTACREASEADTTGASAITTYEPPATTGTTTTSGGDAGGTSDVVATTTSTTSTGAVDSSSSSGTSSSSTTGEATTSTASTGTTAPDAVRECLAMVDPGDECMACICTDCLELWDDCHADEGCTTIQQCAQDNGCYVHDCLEPCETPIGLWGGIDGSSWLLWDPLTKCLEATCRPLCPW